MIKQKLKKINIIILRSDKDRFLDELIKLGCIDVSTSDELLEDTELSTIADLESIELGQLETNKEKIAVRGTDYTLLLTGWISPKTAPSIETMLSGFVCAWDVRPPYPDELEKAPVKQGLQGILKVFNKNKNRPFSPLSSNQGTEKNG